VQITNAEFGTINMNRKVYFTTSTEVLDIAVASMLWTTGDCTCSLIGDLGFSTGICGAGMAILGQRGQGDFSVKLVGSDQLAFSPIPGCEDIGRWRASQDSRMDESSKFDMRYVT
jgi:hypothetical protein